MRGDACFCSALCRQSAYRQRKTARPKKAHQRIIRERGSERAEGLDISAAEVRATDYETAKRIIEQFEYLGTMPAVARFFFGIFFGDRLGGVVVYGDEAGDSLGVWERYGYAGQIIALSRGACLPWAHEHAASKLDPPIDGPIAARYKVVTATFDRSAGELA